MLVTIFTTMFLMLEHNEPLRKSLNALFFMNNRRIVEKWKWRTRVHLGTNCSTQHLLIIIQYIRQTRRYLQFLISLTAKIGLHNSIYLHFGLAKFVSFSPGNSFIIIHGKAVTTFSCKLALFSLVNSFVRLRKRVTPFLTQESDVP